MCAVPNSGTTTSLSARHSDGYAIYGYLNAIHRYAKSGIGQERKGFYKTVRLTASWGADAPGPAAVPGLQGPAGDRSVGGADDGSAGPD
jgi:hypothetical protein